MKVQKVRIENFKGLSIGGGSLDGKSVLVAGGNASGKTSYIGAIFSALTGEDWPPEPIKEGRSSGKIEVELDGLSIVVDLKKLTNGKTKKTLSLFNTESGEQIKSPRAYLDQVIGELGFDPFKFMRMQPKPQLDYFCSAFGINVYEIDSLYQEANDTIRIAKRDLKTAQDAIEPYEDLESYELLSFESVKNELEKGLAHNSQIGDIKNKMEQKTERAEQIRKELEQLETDLANGEKWLEANEPIDLDELQAKYNGIEEHNEKVVLALKTREAEAKAEEQQKIIEEMTQEKKDLMDQKRAKILEKTKDIPELGFNGDQFTVEGLPFHESQNNTAQQIVTGLKIGASLLNKVKIAKFDGSLLDNSNLEEVMQFAEKAGLQLFIEQVDRDNDKLRIEILEES